MMHYKLYNCPESAQFLDYFNLERVPSEQTLSTNLCLVF